ncbi:MAG: group II intron reverse transcriptase/maturase [Ruminiclostridium sp.]|nr:group II intron reverse transcriptase/maturase [Ruminiclostridium sp.]
MNIKMCVAPDAVSRWENIDFKTAEESVKKLQQRIAKAYSHRCFDKVATLQNKLIHSFYAKALAVNVVASSKGRYTSGIDSKLLDNSNDKYLMISDLRRRGYKPLPLKRIYIPKANGKMRPISIPTMKDRAMQTLYKFTLEPIAELTADDCSFSFRPKRSCRNAISRCEDILLHNPKMEWILKADIKSCFDNISHKWILDNIPMDKIILEKFLKCGFIERDDYHKTECGVPQGGCLSTVICNMTLDGLEGLLFEKFRKSVRIVRYADDIVIFGVDKTLLVQSVLPLVKQFLAERGLTLSDEKTEITYIKNGFTFLGWKVYKSNNQVFSVPSDKNIKSLLEKIEGILKGDLPRSCEDTCKKLNALIRGWLSYYANIAVKQSLYGVEFDVCTLVHSLTDDKRIVDFVQNLFNDFDKKYIN